MYEHILEIIRQIYWIFGNVTCAGYPLPDIDTISATGDLDKHSVLNLVVYGVSLPFCILTSLFSVRVCSLVDR